MEKAANGPETRSGHRTNRRNFARSSDDDDDATKAESAELMAVHYLRRRKSVARGFTVEHRKTPRGWHHALAARHPVTRKGLLHPRAITLYHALLQQADPVPAANGARRVFGKTQAFYAQLCGLSMRRDNKGEVHGARRIREYLKQLTHANMIRKGGRCWFEGGGKHPRLVLWIQPWEEWTLTRFVEAVTESSPAVITENHVGDSAEQEIRLRISRSGCFTEEIKINSGVCGGMGGVGGKEAPAAPSTFPAPSLPPVDNADGDVTPPSGAKVRPAAAVDANRPSAGAGDGGRASAAPAGAAGVDVEAVLRVLGGAALRIFRGAELRAIIEHVAKARPGPLDACDGRAAPPQRPLPLEASRSARGRPDAAPADGARAARPHAQFSCPGGPLGVGCEPCTSWAAAMRAAPAIPRGSPPAPARALSPGPARASPSAVGAVAQARLDEHRLEQLTKLRAAAAADGLEFPAELERELVRLIAKCEQGGST